MHARADLRLAQGEPGWRDRRARRSAPLVSSAETYQNTSVPCCHLPALISVNEINAVSFALNCHVLYSSGSELVSRNPQVGYRGVGIKKTMLNAYSKAQKTVCE